MPLCLAAGVAVGAYSLWSILARPHRAVIPDDHIVYVTERRDSEAVALLYLAATSLLQRTLVALGAIIFVGIAPPSIGEHSSRCGALRRLRAL